MFVFISSAFTFDKIDVFLCKLIKRLFMERIVFYAIDRAHYYAGWFIIMANALGAFAWVYLIYFFTHRNSAIWALIYTYITVNAFVIYK